MESTSTSASMLGGGGSGVSEIRSGETDRGGFVRRAGANERTGGPELDGGTAVAFVRTAPGGRVRAGWP